MYINKPEYNALMIPYSCNIKCVKNCKNNISKNCIVLYLNVKNVVKMNIV